MTGTKMMHNIPGVLLTSVGFAAVSWGTSGSVRAASVVGGLVLLVLSAALTIDFGGDR